MSDLTQTYDIAAPRAEVFRALTEPAVLDRWWTTSSESDPRPGGVSYPWEAGGETLVSFRLEDADGGTRLTLEHTGFPDDAGRDHHDQGWAGFLDNLRSVLTGGADQRAEMMGLQVRAPR